MNQCIYVSITCAPHLTSLLVFLVTLLFNEITVRFGSKALPPAFKNFVEIEILVLSPLLNPLNYGLK